MTNITRKYFCVGAKEEKEGMTLLVQEFDKEGNLVSGIPNYDKMYKLQEITESMAKKLSDDIALSPSFGALNDEGMKAFAQHQKDVVDEANQIMAQRLLEENSDLLLLHSKGLISQEELLTVMELKTKGNPSLQEETIKLVQNNVQNN